MSLTLAIVGAGRVGRAVGRRLRDLGWTVNAVITRSRATSRAAARAIGGGTPFHRLTPRLLAADVVLIATPDDAVRDVAARLARFGGREWSRKVVLHTSGVLSYTVLDPLARRGARTGSLHPMQTFSGRGLPVLEGVLIGIEGVPAALRIARRMARDLGGVPVRVDAAMKPAYHAAGGFAAAHLLSVMEAGTQILMSLGFTRRQAVRALGSLACQTLENFSKLGPRESWTGPVARGDFSTVTRHVAALRRYPAEFAATYAALSRLGVRLLDGRGEVMRRLNDALAGAKPARRQNPAARRKR